MYIELDKKMLHWKKRYTTLQILQALTKIQINVSSPEIIRFLSHSIFRISNSIHFYSKQCFDLFISRYHLLLKEDVHRRYDIGKPRLEQWKRRSLNETNEDPPFSVSSRVRPAFSHSDVPSLVVAIDVAPVAGLTPARSSLFTSRNGGSRADQTVRRRTGSNY